MLERLVVGFAGNADISVALADHNVTNIAITSRGVIQVSGGPPAFPLRYPLKLKDVLQKGTRIFRKNLPYLRSEVLKGLPAQIIDIARDPDAETTLHGKSECMLKPSSVGLSFAQGCIFYAQLTPPLKVCILILDMSFPEFGINH